MSDGAAARGHAYGHYAETLHAYALEISSRLVWDFAGGGSELPRPRPPALPGSAWRASSHRVLRALLSQARPSPHLFDLENEPDVEDAETGDGAAALDESGEASIPRLRMKLVEMAHPSTQLLNRSGERSQRPTPARLSELAQARSLAAHARRRSRVGVRFAHAREPPTGRYRGRGGRPHPSETREPRV